MPEDAAAGVRARDWRILIDVNAHEDVDEFFRRAGAVVFPARTIFAKGTPDFEIDKYAQELGCIIVSHDRQFMKLIQRRVYQRDISAATGYGRILLCGSEKRQSRRLQEVLPLLRLYHRWTVTSDHRFVVTVADNWIRFDDKPIARVMRGNSTSP